MHASRPRARRAARTIAALLAALAAGSGAGCTDAEATRAAARIDLSGLVGYWAVLGQDSDGNTYIRPAVRFRVRNTNPDPTEYIQVMSVFRRESAPEESWGTAYLHSATEEPLLPGGETAEHTLRSDSNYLSQARPRQMFEHELWEDVEVEMFVRVGASSWVSRGRVLAERRLGPPGVEKYLEPIEGEPIYEEAPPVDLPSDPPPDSPADRPATSPS